MSDFDDMIADLGFALHELGCVLAFFVDEIQDLDADTLSALLRADAARQHAFAAPYLFGAGLPNVLTGLAERHLRIRDQVDFRLVDFLSEADARNALVLPAARRQVTFADDALDALVETAGGYPYFVQVFGDHAWRCATGPEIKLVVARRAIESGNEAIESGLFASRWALASLGQRHFMRSIAALEDPDYNYWTYTRT